MMKCLLVLPLVFALAASAAAQLPPDWNPTAAGDEVLSRLIRVTAPHVKGAHDAEFVCVGDRAYIVEHDNDVKPGHSAGAAQYCVLSIVNLGTLEVEQVVPLAKSEQAFENATLPVGACFVPRILQLDDARLRCYFTSEDGARREAQMWYRDFDVTSRTFEPGIHKARLKTSAGVFDMQPQPFHADAVAHGFTKPAQRFGLYIFDSFKQFDGRRYVALNNFPGKQNALALVHDDGATFEIVGHYNEPAAQKLSESAVNRLPDGTWLAICRNDGGNYHFTTSRDGRTWSVGKEMPFVPNGTNSKPTFDRFGGVYYLGWQENASLGGGRRSVFNLDVSRDGQTWERKYRFESPDSFQYPTFHEHDGVIWLSVTQGHLGSTDRIMFGHLERIRQDDPR
ncbi:MAG: exo-alpha-sialidase [Planctomycetaceae bacterium]|nr:exo-alpha-sialidase [Planctomycetaceae bacterium]